MEQAKAQRRFREVAVSTVILKDVFKGGCFFKSDLPEDIEVDGVYYEHACDCMIVRLVSPRFEPTPMGSCPPREDGVETFYLEHIDEED